MRLLNVEEVFLIRVNTCVQLLSVIYYVNARGSLSREVLTWGVHSTRIVCTFVRHVTSSQATFRSNVDNSYGNTTATTICQMTTPDHYLSSLGSGRESFSLGQEFVAFLVIVIYLP